MCLSRSGYENIPQRLTVLILNDGCAIHVAHPSSSPIMTKNKPYKAKYESSREELV